MAASTRSWWLGILYVGASLAAAGATGCTSLTTGPTWTGGGLAYSRPRRIAEEEQRIVKEQQERARDTQTIGAKHVLVMHDKSERKPEGITRPRDEAKKRAEECLAKIRGGAEFDAIVVECSDEPGAAKRGGDLGTFQRRAMVKEFADAAFGLRVGEVSDVVESPFGFHIIKRTE
jgi:NIMA-interacting peptidyl-prolyl cis-trans isomerase 1